MNRRSLLAGAGVVLAVPLVGCLDSTEPPSTTVDNDDVEPGEPVYTIQTTVLEHVESDVFDVELETTLVTETVTDTTPAEIRVSLTNNESDPIPVSSRVGWPFGVSPLERQDTDERVYVPLWSDRYAESPNLSPDDKNVTFTDSITETDTVDAGSSVEAIYELYDTASDLEPGIYTTTFSNSLERGDKRDSHQRKLEIVIEAIDG